MDTTIKIVFEPTLVARNSADGEAHYSFDEIKLQPDTNGEPMPQEKLEQVFFHELTHWIFHKLNEKELQSNEKLVDTFSACLTQALRSGKII